jgi:hypothetical protein
MAALARLQVDGGLECEWMSSDSESELGDKNEKELKKLKKNKIKKIKKIK